MYDNLVHPDMRFFKEMKPRRKGSRKRRAFSRICNANVGLTNLSRAERSGSGKRRIFDDSDSSFE